MIEVLFLTAVFTLIDPAGDATGVGDLAYPSAEVFQVPGVFDARELTVLDDEGFSFSLRMAELTNPWNLPLGFSLPIVELYLDTRHAGGALELLPGSGMRLPEGVRWHYAFRLSGDRLELWRAEADGSLREVSARYGANLSVEDTTLTITSTLPRPRHFSLYGAVGAYDPWDATAWRRVMPEAETFAFGSPYQAATGIRVVDVLADSPEAQASAMRSGVLPEIRPPSQQTRWPPVIAAGVALALLGSVARLVVGRRSAARREPTIGYGARRAPKETRVEPTYEPADLFARLPPIKSPAPEPGAALTPGAAPRRVRIYPLADRQESEASLAPRPASRVGVFDAPGQDSNAHPAPRAGRVGVFDAPDC